MHLGKGYFVIELFISYIDDRKEVAVNLALCQLSVRSSSS